MTESIVLGVLYTVLHGTKDHGVELISSLSVMFQLVELLVLKSVTLSTDVYC